MSNHTSRQRIDETRDYTPDRPTARRSVTPLEPQNMFSQILSTMKTPRKPEADKASLNLTSYKQWSYRERQLSVDVGGLSPMNRSIIEVNKL